ncbi:MAG: hypothetical protein LBS63_01475 [Prevotellaceae bacterium]|jgi:hypothetical protein|nr:hypothetical protein [Prevotellaceae bacterium]
MNKLLQLFSNKIMLTALLLVLLCVGVWLYFFIREGEKKNSMDAMRSIPADASFALRVNDLGRLTRKLSSEAALAQLIASDATAAKLARQLRYVVDTMAHENEAVGSLARQTIWVSAHVFGKELSFLFSLNLSDNLYLNNVKQIIPLLEKSGYHAADKPYDDERIFTFYRREVEEFHAAVVRRVLVASRSRVLVEMAVRQAKTPSSLADNFGFMQAAKAAGKNVDVNLYLNHRQLPKLLELYTDQPYARQLDFLSRLGSFTVLDANMADAVLLTGVLRTENLQGSYFSALAGQGSQKLSCFEILPRTTDGVLCLGIDNVRKLLANYAEFRERRQSGNAQRKEKVAQLSTKIGTDVAAYFAALHPSELALAHVPTGKGSEKDEWFVVIKSDRINAASKAVKAAIAGAAKGENRPESYYALTESMSNKEPLTIYRNPARGFIAALQGSLFAKCDDAYLTFIGSYLIFSSSPAAMKDFALLALLKKTLAQATNLSDYTIASNLFIYLNPSKPDAVALNALKPSLKSRLKKSPAVAGFNGVGVLMSVMSSSEVYCNIFFKAASKTEEKQRARSMALDFEVKLDAPLLAAPWVLQNHRTGQKEILAQDIRNNIYLIDRQGILLWKKALGEAIMGPVHQIDYLSNKKLQMLFNTKTKLYLIDRLGNSVEGFPVKLPSPASAPMAVFDYDRSRSYRYFVPCEDGKIRAFEQSGRPLTGFAPVFTFGSVTLPLTHVRTHEKDYILVADNRRTYILNRQGEERVHVRERVTPAYNSSITPEVGPKGDVACMVTTTAEGDLVYVYFDGSVDHQTLKPKPHEYHFFNTFNNVADRQATYAVIDEKTLHAYGGDLEPKFTYTFRRPVRTGPHIFIPLPSVRLYSVFVEDEQQAYLIDDGGDLLSGFPIKAVAPITVDNLHGSSGAYCVLACDENSFLSCYNVEVAE